MIHKILANTPVTYMVQIFVNLQWWESEIHTFHRGMVFGAKLRIRIILVKGSLHGTRKIQASTGWERIKNKCSLQGVLS
jgi:hypothetical protein